MKKSGLGEIEAHNLAEPGDVLVIQGIAGVSRSSAPRKCSPWLSA